MAVECAWGESTALVLQIKKKQKQTHNNEFNDLFMWFLENKRYQAECHQDPREDVSWGANSTITPVTVVLNLNWIHYAPN